MNIKMHLQNFFQHNICEAQSRLFFRVRDFDKCTEISR